MASALSSSSSTPIETGGMGSMTSMSTMMTFNNDNTMLNIFSTSFSPRTTGQYVGAWFFCFFLAVSWKALQYAMFQADQYWLKQHSMKSITIKGGDVIIPGARVAQAWRASVNIPRALLACVTQGVAYLLMIIVMILNVGLFFAIMVGILIGELIFGRIGVHGAAGTGC